MTHGIGVRYAPLGVRLLGLKRSDEGFEITNIYAGLSGGQLDSLIADSGVSTDDCSVVVGLSPGDFISAFLTGNNIMNTEELQEQLRWEIERKMISDKSEYNIDYAFLGNCGMAFAGRRMLVDKIRESVESAVTDVEPIALYNGCESAGEIEGGSVMLISVEAEGISSVVLQKGSFSAVESFPIQKKELAPILSGLNHENIKNIGSEVTERMADYALESIRRLTSLGDDKSKTTPESLVLAGGGVYIGDLASAVERKSGIPTIVSNPFASLANDAQAFQPELAEMSAAFTTCFGLAVRALEE